MTTTTKPAARPARPAGTWTNRNHGYIQITAHEGGGNAPSMKGFIALSPAERDELIDALQRSEVRTRTNPNGETNEVLYLNVAMWSRFNQRTGANEGFDGHLESSEFTPDEAPADPADPAAVVPTQEEINF